MSVLTATARRRWPASPRLAALLLLPLALLAGCPQPPVVAMDGGTDTAAVSPPDAGFRFDGFGDLGQPDLFAPVFVDEISPATGVVTGGYRIRVAGDGFNVATTVWFGAVQGDNVLLQNSRSLTVRVPPADEGGPVDVTVDNGTSSVTVPAGFIYFDALEIHAVAPEVLPTSGGTEVVVDGAGYLGDLLVLCGGRAVASLVVESETRLRFVAPPGVAGLTGIEILSPFGRVEKPLALLYYSPLTLDRLEPAYGPLAGGTTVMLHGGGFTSLTRVLMGGSVVASTTIDAERVQVWPPARAVAGSVDVEVEDSRSQALLPGGYHYQASPSGPVRLDAVVPTHGKSLGGEVVVLIGAALDSANLVVEFDGVSAEVQQQLSAQSVEVRTPAHPPGTVMVTVQSEAGGASLAGAFVFDPTLTLTTIAPALGPAAGGTPLTVVGEGFTAETVVRLGGRPLTEQVLVDPFTITGTSPVGSAGEVDVEVVDPGLGRAALVGGYRYQAELQVLGVRPVRGGMAGGTLTSVYGAGFRNGELESVRFGAWPATAVHVESDNLITLRTPPQAPAVVAVEVARGAELARVERAYTYYDPSSLFGGTRGDVIDGALYVTCFHAITGLPLEGITVQLGTQPVTPYIALTDVYGQATLSGPDVRGPQVVTAAAAGYESITLIEVNATQISLFMYPTSMTPSSGQPPPLPPPPSISGMVFGFAKELFDPAALGPTQSALAIVQTTIRSVFSSAGAPTETQYVVAEGGSYYIPGARPGRLAVVAVAGVYDLLDQSFRPRQIGFRRGVVAAYGDVLEDVDIELSVPLNTQLSVYLPDIPYGEAGPDTAVLMPYLNFGGEGVYPLTQQLIPGATSVELSDFPDVPGELLTFVAGAFSVDNSNPMQPVLASPYSAVVRDGVGDLRSGLTLGPLLGFPELIEPVENGAMTGNRIRWKRAPGVVPSYYDIYIAGFDGTLWSFFVPGNLTKLVVPAFPELNVENPPQNMGQSAFQWWMSAVYVPGFSFDNFSYLELSSLARRSWTQEVHRFANSGTAP